MDIIAGKVTGISEIYIFSLKNQAHLEFYKLRIFIVILCEDRLLPIIKTFGEVDI